METINTYYSAINNLPIDDTEQQEQQEQQDDINEPDLQEIVTRTPSDKPFFSPYPSIGQFREVIAEVVKRTQWIGKDADGKDIYNYTKTLPMIKFSGTVKLHGTNSGVLMNNNVKPWAVSRTKVILPTPTNDNAEFAKFVEKNQDVFAKLINYVSSVYRINLNENTIGLYGEWAGKKIQKGVAIANIDRFFTIFGIKVIPFDGLPSWVDCGIPNMESPDHRIFNIKYFKMYEVIVDFANPQLAQNDIVAMTQEVDNECPVGKAFGQTGVGEGIVFTATYENKRYQFKSKGLKHTVSKVKTIASIDVDNVNGVNTFVDYSLTENRLNQAIERVFTMNNIKPSFDKIPVFVSWVVKDILAEEKDTIEKNNLLEKDVTKEIGKRTVTWFRKYIQTN